MADVTELNLQIVLQEIGGNDNTWGDVNNENMQKLVDAVTEKTDINVAGGIDITLDDNQQRSMVLNLTGILTADITIFVNDSPKLWFIDNLSTGGFDITVSTDSGTGVIIGRLSTTAVYSDGTNCISVSSSSALDFYEIGTFTEGVDVNTLTAADTEYPQGTYEEGLQVTGRIASSNTDAMTFNFNTIGVLAVTDQQGNAIERGAVTADSIVTFAYNSARTNWTLRQAPDVLRQITAPRLAGNLDVGGHRVDQNVGSDIASAATITIPNDGNYFHITGITNISAINTVTYTEFDTTFTADDTTDRISVGTDDKFADGDQVLLSTTTTLPAPLTPNTIYYIRDIAAANCKLATTPGGTAINITDTGVGTHTVSIARFGTEVEFEFDGILDLIHSTNFFMFGANITTAAGDVCVFRQVSGAGWKMLSYTRADGSVGGLGTSSSISTNTITADTGNITTVNGTTGNITTVNATNVNATGTVDALAVETDTLSDAAGTGPTDLTAQVAAKAWSNLNGVGTIAERDSFNIASYTDTSTGQYLHTLSASMTSVNYMIGGTTGGTSGSHVMNGNDSNVARTAGAYSMHSAFPNVGSRDDAQINSSVHGDLA